MQQANLFLSKTHYPHCFEDKELKKKINEIKICKNMSLTHSKSSRMVVLIVLGAQETWGSIQKSLVDLSQIGILLLGEMIKPDF